MSAGQALRDSGIARVSCGREDWIAYARSVAVEVAEANGQVTINDIRERIELPDGFPANAGRSDLQTERSAPC